MNVAPYQANLIAPGGAGPQGNPPVFHEQLLAHNYMRHPGFLNLPTGHIIGRGGYGVITFHVQQIHGQIKLFARKTYQYNNLQVADADIVEMYTREIEMFQAIQKQHECIMKKLSDSGVAQIGGMLPYITMKFEPRGT